MFEFGYRKTFPQGLLLASVLLMLSNLCLNMQIVNLAPRYVMYGAQVYLNGTSVIPCTINAPTDLCIMSEIGLLTSRIQLGISFFGIVFYYGTWVIVATFILGLAVSIFKRRPSAALSYSGDSDEEEI